MCIAIFGLGKIQNKPIQESNREFLNSQSNCLILKAVQQEVMDMMKKVILLSVLAVSLTGCVMDPHDGDYRGHKDRDKHHDQQRGDRDWNNKDRPDWNNNKDRHDWNPGRNDRNPPPPPPNR